MSENELDESRTPETSAADSSAVMESVEPHGDEPASHVSPGDQGGAEGLYTDVPDESDGTDETDVLDDGLGAPTLAAALEALLIVTEQPMQAAELAAFVRCPEAEVCDVLEQLSADYAEAGRGFDLRQVAGGWRFYTRADCAEVVERFVRDGQQSRLSQAALETLAVIAYRQPVARSRIAAIRGVSVDGVIRTLTSRGLIVESGQETGTGALLYQTTDLFLDRLGIASLGDLPPVMDYLPNLDTLEDFLDQTSS